MRYFEELVTSYNAIDKQLAGLESEAARRSFHRKKASYQKRRELNDQAYFLLMFAQFEYLVNDAATRLITRKKALSSWERKRAWYILLQRGEKINNIPFLKRVALLLDKGDRRFALITQYYRDRNLMAHGELPSTSAPMVKIIGDLRAISQLVRHNK